NVIGITDATRIAGTGVKSGKLGSLKNGTDVIVDDGVAKLPDLSSYAGSICTMDRALRILCVEYGVDPVTAAKMLSTNPARQIGIRTQRGAIEESMLADFVITDHEFKILTVIKEGEIINN
ncbi:MAG: amidohydrolase family protein, partial [Lachnospiraceae bacterium]|nr:amidohydrolase family protein [Lachnospiraceae bacterium]